MLTAKNAVEFMKTNVVLIGSFPMCGKYWAKLEGGEGRFNLVNAGGEGDGHFEIYWCHYEPEKVYSTTLGSQAELMFTPRMSGCSFARGIPSGEGDVVVGHANINEGTGITGLHEVDKALDNKKNTFEETIKLMALRHDLVMQFQLEMLKSEFGNVGIAGLLDRKNENYEKSTELTTFAVREGKIWKFYFQGRTGNRAGQIVGVYEF